MDLKNTVSMMNSDDYKERFRAEYFQLKNRIEGLNGMLEKYRKNQLNFQPKCSVKILDGQLNAMKSYMTHLIERANIEGIDLKEPELINNKTQEPIKKAVENNK